MADAYIARQPVVDRRLNTAAYELLFRAGPEDRARIGDGEEATSAVLVAALMEFGIDKLAGPLPILVNVNRSFLLSGHALLLPRDRVILELLEDIEPDDEVVAAALELKQRGYRLALDDFVYEPGRQPLVELADLVKIEVPGRSSDELAREIGSLAPYAPRLVAEKVETHEEHEQARELGFDLFQGYFFCRPDLVRRRDLPLADVVRLRLLASLEDPESELEELERLVSQDVSVSYRLLRYVNSAYVALPRRVSSMREALVYLGRDTVRRWATLLLLGSFEGKPSELLTVGMIRARMCELLAGTLGRNPDDGYFMTGLFSIVDALVDLPLEEVLSELPLSESIFAALVAGEGPQGDVLARVRAYERGDFDAATPPGMGASALAQIYLQAVAWAVEESWTTS
jgi:EAL and modified HD-GYP domain-containing signal transduction protein